MTFRDRVDAGRRLAERLAAYRGGRTVVVALPRGGVPVAAEVARALDAPLDVLVVRKLGCPWQPELGMGAIAEGDITVLNEELIARIVQRGIDNGEFEPLDVPSVVHSLMLPLVMLCLHKHSLGACPGHDEHFDPHLFVRSHIDLVIRGLARTKPASRRAAAA